MGFSRLAREIEELRRRQLEPGGQLVARHPGGEPIVAGAGLAMEGVEAPEYFEALRPAL